MTDERKGKALPGNPHHFRGFSLLEMMAVVTFTLLLASFAMPSFMTIVVRAHEAVLREDLFTMRSQIERFTHDNERGPTSLEELVEQKSAEEKNYSKEQCHYQQLEPILGMPVIRHLLKKVISE